MARFSIPLLVIGLLVPAGVGCPVILAEAQAVADDGGRDLPPGSFDPDELFIELVSSRFGKTVHIYGNGSVHLWKWMPERLDKELSCVVSQDKVLELLIEFHAWDFFSLRNTYGPEPHSFRIDSLGNATMIGRGYPSGTINMLTVRIGDYVKTVERKDWGPRQLLHLEKAVVDFALSSLSEEEED